MSMGSKLSGSRSLSVVPPSGRGEESGSGPVLSQPKSPVLLSKCNLSVLQFVSLLNKDEMFFAIINYSKNCVIIH